MPNPTLDIMPEIVALGPQNTPQVCYVLAVVGASGQAEAQTINWAFVADASRSMRIPIVDEAQFRALIRSGGAQEVLVDGVPVWQLQTALSPEVRAATRSPLEYVAQALHAILERLDNGDYFTLVACAESAEVLLSGPGDARAELVRGIERLLALRLGDQTDLAKGMALALEQLRRGRGPSRRDHVLLLTDGFTLAPERCVALADVAAAEGVTISTIGLGGEFQEDVLTAVADRSGGSARLIHHASEIARVVADELQLVRGAALPTNLRIMPCHGTTVRRLTRVEPTLAILHEGATEQVVSSQVAGGAGEATLFLLELLVPAGIESRATIAELVLANEHGSIATRPIVNRRYAQPPALPEQVRDAAARANVARLHKRAVDAAKEHEHAETARLLETAALRLDELGANTLARRYRDEAAAFDQQQEPPSADMKELTYATRRLGKG